jgi:Cu2+-containing amine oxidase
VFVVAGRSRRLVLSFMCTIGNYDYAFYYDLYQDGQIHLRVGKEAKAQVPAGPGRG